MRIPTPRIVQPGDRSRGWLWILVAVTLGAWSWQVFEFGRHQAGFSVNERNHAVKALERRIAELEQERDALRADAARFERAGQIDRAAADGVQAEIRSLQDERAELKREVAFLKSLVSGEEHQLALTDHRLAEIDERAYRFEVTLSKSSDKEGMVEGDVVVSVRGEAEGLLRTLDMETLTDGRRSRIGIKFKNFQKLSADLRLPEGFEPTEVLVEVKPRVEGFGAFQQSFAWSLTDA